MKLFKFVKDVLNTCMAAGAVVFWFQDNHEWAIAAGFLTVVFVLWDIYDVLFARFGKAMFDDGE